MDLLPPCSALPVSTAWIDLPGQIDAGPRPLYVLSDVHGQSALMKAAGAWLEAAAAGHVLAILGDLVSRGPDSRGCLEEALRLRASAAFAGHHAIRGNHCIALQARLAKRIDFLRKWGALDLEKVIAQRDPRGLAVIRDYLAPLRYWVRHGDLVLVHAIPDPRLAASVQDWPALTWASGNREAGPDWSALDGRPALLVHGHVCEAVVRRRGGSIRTDACIQGIDYQARKFGRICVDARINTSGVLPVAEFHGRRMRMHYWSA